MFNFELILTTRCNLSCDYCYARFLEKQDMPFELIRKLIDNYPISKLIFTGGEPLLKFGLIKQTLEYVRKSHKEISFRIQTNGTILDEEISNFIKRNKIEMEISLDGLQSYHDAHRRFKNNRGSYSIILNNLNSLKAQGVRFSINYTVTPDTIKGLAENLLFLIKKYTVDVGFVFTEKPISPETTSQYLYEIKKFLYQYLQNKLFLEIDKIYPFEFWFRALLFNQYDKITEILSNRCKYPKLRVLPTGEIYPCIASYSLIPHQFKSRCKLGNIKRLNYKRLNFFRKKLDLSNWLTDKRLKGCNRVCYLYAQNPANRFEFEKKVIFTGISVLKKYIDNLDITKKEYLKSILQKKLISLEKKLDRNNNS